MHDFEKNIREIKELIDSGDMEQALNLIENKKNELPENNNFEIVRAICLVRLKRFEEAADTLRIILNKDSGYQKAAQMLHEIDTILNRAKGEATILKEQKPESRESVSAESALEMAKKALQYGNDELAFDVLIKIKSSGGNIKELNYLQAVYFLKKGQQEMALDALDKELMFFPANIQAANLYKLILLPQQIEF